MTYSCTQKTSKHIDHVCCYIGLSNSTNNNNNNDESQLNNINNNTTTISNASTLYGLNELAQKNRLILCRRQVSNRDIRILIPNSNTSTSESLNTHDSNYKKFLYNFNILSYACYLTALNANENLWNKYDIPQQLAKDTSFFVIGSSPAINEKCMKVILEDEEFVNNYSNIMFNIHNKVSNELYRVLNTNLPHNYDFIDKLKTNESNDFKGDTHLFRTFRIIGLRHPIKENHKVGNLNEIIEIRVSFDIRQSASKSTYDCFIECELSYYKIAPIIKKSSSSVTSDLKWFNMLNNDLKKSNRAQKYSISSSHSSLEFR